MKIKAITALCAAGVVLSTTTPGFASEEPGSLAVVADAVIARPACFAATIIGSALFVVSLPVAATSRSVKKTARVLVVKPAKATFTRPLGDLDNLKS